MIISMQKIKDDSSLKCYPPMMNMSIQKMQYINWLLQEILMIKYPAIWLDKRPTWPHPTKGDSFTCYLTLRTNSMQKKTTTTEILIEFLLRYCWSKNSAIWLAERHVWPHLKKVVVSTAIFPWRLFPYKNSKKSFYSFYLY